MITKFKLYENRENELNRILDLKNGGGNLTPEENNFLTNYDSIDYDKYMKDKNTILFNDDNFSFKLETLREYGAYVNFYGVMLFPSIALNGFITYDLSTKQIIAEFEDEDKNTAYDHCEDLEEEFYSFLEEIIQWYEKDSDINEGVDMKQLEEDLKKAKKDNPNKKVSYYFVKGDKYPKGYKINIK